MRRDELFQVVPRTPHPSVPPFHRQRNRIIRRTFRSPHSPSSFLFPHFFFRRFLAISPLNFSFLLSPLLRACANVNFTETSLACRYRSNRVFSGDIVFLDISRRPIAKQGRRWENALPHLLLPCSCARRSNAIVENLRHDSQELSTMKFANGTISFRFIHFSYRHHKQYISQAFASFPTYV